MRQGIIKLALLASILGVVALAPSAASADNTNMYVKDGTAWTYDSLTVPVGDQVTWAVNRTAEGELQNGHDLWVCNSSNVTSIECFYDTSDEEAEIPPSFVANRKYCGTNPSTPLDQCDDGQPSDVTVNFDTPGTYTYICQVHSGSMRGLLTVAAPQPVYQISIAPAKVSLKKGKSKTVTVKVSNTGSGPANGVKVCATGPKTKVKLGKCVNYATVAPGETRNAKIKVTVQKGKKAKGSATVKFKTTDNEGASITKSFKVTIKK